MKTKIALATGIIIATWGMLCVCVAGAYGSGQTANLWGFTGLGMMATGITVAIMTLIFGGDD